MYRIFIVLFKTNITHYHFFMKGIIIMPKEKRTETIPVRVTPTEKKKPKVTLENSVWMFLLIAATKYSTRKKPRNTLDASRIKHWLLLVILLMRFMTRFKNRFRIH